MCGTAMRGAVALPGSKATSRARDRIGTWEVSGLAVRCCVSGTIRIGRREFITLLGSAAVSWPLSARAQQMKLPTIGLLGGATPSAQAQWTAAFVQRLRELGWVEGQTVTIEYRWVEGRFERSPAITAEFVRLKVDVIVTHATPSILAAKQVTSVVPIVFRSAGDPVGRKLVNSLARPGGNVTGVSVQSSELAQKVVELLRDFLPKHGRLAMMHQSVIPSQRCKRTRLRRGRQVRPRRRYS